MYVSKWGAKIRSQKDRIIKMHKVEGIRILDIAKKYHVTERTMYKYFYAWGVEIKRGKIPYQRRFKEDIDKDNRKHWYRKYSVAFLLKRVERSKICKDKKPIYIKTVNHPEDARLIRHILNRAFI